MASFEQLTDEQRANLARAAHKIYNNPETSKDAKRLLQKADPTVRFPELETEDVVTEQLKSRDKKIEELEQQQMQHAAEARRRDKHKEALERGLDPEEVEKAITERGIVKWETAMEFVEMTHRAAPATSDSIQSSGNSTQMPDGDAAKEFWADPAKWANKQAHAAVDELSQRRKLAR